MKILLYVLLALLFVMSCIAFGFYVKDKACAKKGAWRVPEKVLLSLGFFGGAIGALLAMKLVRHKTKHWYFWVVNILGLVWQLAAVVFLLVQTL